MILRDIRRTTSVDGSWKHRGGKRNYRRRSTKKICLLMSFPDDTGDDIPDPMVTNDYEQAYDDIHFGCRGLLWEIMTKDEPETDKIFDSRNEDIDYLISLFQKPWDNNEG